MENTDPIFVGVSGGKDSSLSAWILKKLGFDITLIYFKTPWHNSPPIWLSELLKAPLEVIDITQEFTKFVIEPFARYYLSGLTPNPCAFCNRFIKFGILIKKIEEKFRPGNLLLATGHYVKLSENDGEILLEEYGKDSQSYFLSLVRPENLRKALFPLSRKDLLEKLGLPYPIDQKITKEIARESGLLRTSSSRDICFVKTNYRGFLKRYYMEKLKEDQGFAFRGIVLHKESGEQMVFPRNFWEITLGQKFAGEYVISKEMNQNGSVIVKTSRSISKKVRIETGFLNIISPKKFSQEIKKGTLPVRLRYRQPLLAGEIEIEKPEAENSQEVKKITVITETRNFYPAPGQVLSLYDSSGKHILAGAVIQRVVDLDS